MFDVGIIGEIFISRILWANLNSKTLYNAINGGPIIKKKTRNIFQIVIKNTYIKCFNAYKMQYKDIFSYNYFIIKLSHMK